MGKLPPEPSEARPETWPEPVFEEFSPQEVETPPRPRRKRWKLKLLLGLGTLAALAGTGWYSWTAYHELATLRGEHHDLSDALELHRASVDELDTKLGTCERDLTTEKVVHVQRNQQATELEIALGTCRGSLGDLEQQQAEARARLGEFEQLTSHFQNMIDTGQLDVVFRRGQMIVQLPAAILFSSGSAKVSEGGVEALESVAEILAQLPQRRFTVAGHTDNVPVGSAPFDNNWDLSASRAVAVTEVLIHHGIRPRNLVAAGYGEYAPIVRNRTERGRRQNRRIEIILEPDLRPILQQGRD